MITIRDIMRARESISRHVLRTPEVQSDYLSDVTGASVYLKLECLQHLHSFKIRGAMNKALSLTPEERARGLLAVSSGNHGAAVSYCAKLLGIKADIFVPEGTPDAKLQKIRRYGANLHISGKTYDESHSIAKAYLARTDKVYVDPASDEVAVAGHGTIGLEIMEAVPRIDVILVPIGGGGLITGVSLAAKFMRPGVKVIGVQTEACPAMLASLRDKVFYEDYPSAPSICDAVVGGIGEIGYAYASKCIDKVVTAGEDAVKEAMIELLRKDKVVAEPSGALGPAYLLENPDQFAGLNVAVVVSGGNVDFDLLRREMASFTEKHRATGQPPI
ncbi:MAG: threonine/serine dehydratase [Bacillota bacterium]